LFNALNFGRRVEPVENQVEALNQLDQPANFRQIIKAMPHANNA
jgi:hypothetical protein